MRALRLTESYIQYTYTRNQYGDDIFTRVGMGKCLYRDISQLNRNVNSREEIAIQGIFWFASSDAKQKGDIIGYNGLFYRLEHIIIGKQLVSTNNIHFYKCNASLLRQIS